MSWTRPDNRKRVTIRDVSAKSGVSIGTVSNVINAPGVVAEATRIKVQEAITELGYAPAAAARSLKSRRAFMLGYPMYDSDPASVMGEFFRELVRRAETHGLGVQAFVSDRESYQTSFTRLLDSGAVDGFVLSEVVAGDARVRWLIDNDVPFAAFGRADIDDRYPCVDLDIVNGMQQVARHILDLGHNRVAYIGWDAKPTNCYRLEGAEKELAERGLELVDAVTSDFSAGGGYLAAKELLDGANPPTAIICAQDVIAAGALRAASERGQTIGRELAISGFDDTPLALATSPPLTSVRFPLDQVAHGCVELFVNGLDDDAPATTFIQPELVVRESTAGV